MKGKRWKWVYRKPFQITDFSDEFNESKENKRRIEKLKRVGVMIEEMVVSATQHPKWSNFKKPKTQITYASPKHLKK